MLNPSLRKGFQKMATKRKKGDIDREAFLNSFDQDEFANLVKTRIERRGIDWLLDGMSAKKRDELLRRLQADAGKKKPAANS